MAFQELTTSQSTPATILWDDSQVLVFQISSVITGFAHTQITVSSGNVQVATDAQDWIETIKFASRNPSSAAITISYDDSIFAQYTPPGNPNQTFQIQQLFSIRG
jgi:hypothetical protein